MTGFLIWVEWVNHMNRVSSNRKPKKYLGIFAIVAIFIFGGVSSAFASDIFPQKVIELVNAERKEKNIPELAENEKLSRAASKKAEDMISKNYFSHTSPDNTTPWYWIEREGYDYNYAGENLAMDFVTAEKMNQAWLASPTHRANILNEKYKDIGVAIKEGIISGHITIVVVQMFGSGDKSPLSGEKTNSLIQKEKVFDNYMPILPINKDRSGKIVFEKPLITSPQKNEILNDKEINIVGRANPLSKVAIFDGGVAVGESISNEKGWFKLKIENISEGKHELMAKTDIFFSEKKETKVSDKISFQIDREKPILNYHLQVKGEADNYLVELFSDKKNCSFQLGEEQILNNFGNTVVFSVKTDQSSIMATVRDQAGNKSRKQIVLANYFAGSGKNIFDNLALSFSSKTAFANNSERKTLFANLGLVFHHFFNS